MVKILNTPLLSMRQFYQVLAKGLISLEPSPQCATGQAVSCETNSSKGGRGKATEVVAVVTLTHLRSKGHQALQEYSLCEHCDMNAIMPLVRLRLRSSNFACLLVRKGLVALIACYLPTWLSLRVSFRCKE
jgi:hypothetical protein